MQVVHLFATSIATEFLITGVVLLEKSMTEVQNWQGTHTLGIT